MTPAEKARNIAESMATHGLDIYDPATWARYGLTWDQTLEAHGADQDARIEAVCRILSSWHPGRVEPLLDRR